MHKFFPLYTEKSKFNDINGTPRVTDPGQKINL